MKHCIFSLLVLGLIFLSRTAYAADQSESSEPVNCPMFKMEDPIKSLYYVAKDQPPIHFYELNTGETSKAYVVSGDLVVVNAETQNFICGHYVNHGKVAASGWIKKSEMQKLDTVHAQQFKNAIFNSKEPFQKGPFAIVTWNREQDLEAANKKLLSIAENLPPVKNWRGIWQDSNGDSVEIWKSKSTWMLDVSGISGKVSAGDRSDSFDLFTKGAMAEFKNDPTHNDLCDIVIIGFNNAIISTSGHTCLGIGYWEDSNGEGHYSVWPEFNGIYWKK